MDISDVTISLLFVKRSKKPDLNQSPSDTSSTVFICPPSYFGAAKSGRHPSKPLAVFHGLTPWWERVSKPRRGYCRLRFPVHRLLARRFSSRIGGVKGFQVSHYLRA